jgi:hypothetical protein
VGTHNGPQPTPDCEAFGSPAFSDVALLHSHSLVELSLASCSEGWSHWGVSKQAVVAVAAPLNRIFAQFEQDGQLVKAWDAIVDTLQPYEELMWTASFKAHFLGCHPQNRGGIGVNVRGF